MFIPKKEKGTLAGWEYFPAAAGTYKVGQLLNAAAGKLSPIDGASVTTPGYVCVADVTVAAGDVIPVQRIVKDAVYATTLSADTASAAIGSKLQVSAGGLQADGAAAGTFELTYVGGTAAGSEVWGRFI